MWYRGVWCGGVVCGMWYGEGVIWEKTGCGMGRGIVWERGCGVG